MLLLESLVRPLGKRQPAGQMELGRERWSEEEENLPMDLCPELDVAEEAVYFAGELVKMVFGGA